MIPDLNIETWGTRDLRI